MIFTQLRDYLLNQGLLGHVLILADGVLLYQIFKDADVLCTGKALLSL